MAKPSFLGFLGVWINRFNHGFLSDPHLRWKKPKLPGIRVSNIINLYCNGLLEEHEEKRRSSKEQQILKILRSTGSL